MSSFVLYHFAFDPGSRAVRLALGEARIEFSETPVRPWEDDCPLATLNPSGMPPVLRISDDKGRALTLCEPAAILGWLEERTAEPLLLPTDVAERAEVRRLLAWFDRRFTDEVNAVLLHEGMEKPLLRLGPPEARALRAGREALHDAGVAAASITHVVTASCTGFVAPGIDQWLMEELSLPRSCRRTHVGFMGCHAAVNALSVAAAFVRADPAARVLVVCAEISSAHLHYGARLDRLIANTLFADGVAAAVVAADGPGDALRFVRSDSVLMEGSVAEMAWEVGDHGFEMTLGAAVPDLLRSGVGPWVRGILAEEAIDPMAVGGWAIHPGGPRVIDAVLESLALEPRHGESSRAILRDFGNMSSATLLFIMRAMRERGIPRPWVALAFGPGIAGEALLLA